MMTARELAEITGGRLILGDESVAVTGFTSDSRTVKKGNCFAVFKGKRFDGNAFITQAVKNGASVILSEEPPTSSLLSERALPAFILTESVLSSLQKSAAYYRNKNIGKTVAITGSVGKTTVKELIYSVLSQRTALLKTEGNNNNVLGLSLTLLSGKTANNAVLELGISNIGEMERLSEIAGPDIAVITNIGNMHAEGFKARKITADEKLRITAGMKKDGILIINGDEPLLTESEHLPENTVRVSVKSKNADYYVHGVSCSSAGTVFDIDKKGKKGYRALFVPIVGKHGALLAGFTVAVGELFGCTEEEIRRGVGEYKPCGDRQRRENINGISCIFDCYNAGPESFNAALEAFGIIFADGGFTARGIVAGDMLELGELSVNAHISLGEKIAELNPELLVTVGKEALLIAMGAKRAGMSDCRIFTFTDINNLCAVADTVKKKLKGGSLLLVKGSRGIRLERLKELL